MLLEQPDRCDSSGSGLQTGSCIFQGNAAESEHRYSPGTGCTQGGQAASLPLWRCGLLEYRRENGKIRLLCLRRTNFGRSMAGNRDHKTVVRPASGGARCAGRNIVGAQMDPAGARGYSYIDPGIDQQAGAAISLRRLNGIYGFPRQRFQFPCAQVALAQLYVIHTGPCSLRDLRQQAPAPGLFVSGKL